MNSLRDAALKSLEQYGLPHKGLEEYLHTDLSKWFEPDWGMNLARLDMPVDFAQAFKCSVPNLSTQLYFLANDSFASSDTATKNLLSDGVFAGSLKEAAMNRPKLVDAFYGKLADMEKPGIAAINTLFAQDGFLLYIPDGVIIEKPLQLITLLSSKVDLLVNRRILVVIGRSAQAKLLLCDHALATNQYLTTQVVEVFAGENSNFELYDLEETHYANRRISELYTSPARWAAVTTGTEAITFPSRD